MINMTVQDVLDMLETIDDKTAPMFIFDSVWDDGLDQFTGIREIKVKEGHVVAVPSDKKVQIGW
jgi:hypothetical protein